MRKSHFESKGVLSIKVNATLFIYAVVIFHTPLHSLMGPAE